ncbi:MAG: Do family serine endopeptidase [Gammaproteobacteria bacterium]|nr:Do family serine endopeptidase [Gammaproteobacteria bacterium]
MSTKSFISNTLASAVAGALIVTGAGYLHLEQGIVQNAGAANTEPALVQGLPDFTSLVTQAGPAVVSIQTVQSIPMANRGIPPGMSPADPSFEFFRRFGPPQGEDYGGQRQGQGSGFIISADGVVLTNAHVVEDADEVNVLLADKRELKAKVLGIDKTTDVAVLKVDAQNLPTLRIGDADSLKVGEWVIAIGSPFGFDHTVSAGVVSAKTRSLPNGGYVPFIQTDVALNPGNSGGPLLNLRGEVVGVNSQIYSRNGGYMGLSFAIPIDLAMDIQRQLVQHGAVERGRLGVSVQSLNQELAASFGMARPAGALVSQVLEGTVAASAGIKPGDVITAIDGKTVDDAATLSRLVAEQKPGRRVTLALLREGKAQKLTLALGSADPALAEIDTSAAVSKPGRLGAVVRALDNEARQALNEDRGVLVERTEGAAARAGLRAGDIILAVNAEAVNDPAQLQGLIAKAPDAVALLVKRNDAEIYIPVSLG